MLNLTAVSCIITNTTYSVLQYLLNSGCISGTLLGTEKTRHLLNLRSLHAGRLEGSLGEPEEPAADWLGIWDRGLTFWRSEGDTEMGGWAAADYVDQFSS